MIRKNNYLYAALSFFIAVTTFLLLILSVPFIFSQDVFTQPVYYLITGILTILSIGLGSFVYLLLSKTRLQDLIINNRIKNHRYSVIAEQIVLAGFIAVFAYPIVVFIQYIWQFLTDAVGMVPIDAPMPDVDNLGTFLLAIFGIAIIPGICEELLFRGVMQKNIMNDKKPIYAILITSTLFMLMHGDVYSIPYTFALGVLMGYLAYRSSSVLPAICYHIVNNTIAVCALYITSLFPQETLMEAESINMSQDISAFIYIGIAALICSVICYFLIRLFNKISHEVKAPETISINIVRKIPIFVSAFLLIILMTLTTLISFGMGL